MTLTAMAPAVTAAVSAVTEVVLVAHGSPDPRHRRSVTTLAHRMSASTGLAVTTCYLEHDEPFATNWLLTGSDPSSCSRHRIVVPLLLTAGYHWRTDIPPIIGHNGHRATLLSPPQPAAFAAAVGELTQGASHVVLASAGSARPEVVKRFADLADVLAGEHEVTVALSPGDITQHARRGSVVVPVLVADGIFADRVRTAADAAGATTTAVLGDTPGFARTLVAEVTAAR